MAKYFITGGAGFLGINLTRYLLERGHQVVSFDLCREYNYPEKNNALVTAVSGDIRDVQALTEAMAGSELVVHAAAALPLYSKKEIFTTDVEGTHNVLQAAQSNGVKRVIMISSTAVYGVPDHHPLAENDRLAGVGPYGEAKIAAEKICAQFRTTGLIVPVLRPKSFIGPERLGVFALLYDWAADGHNFPMIGSGTNRYQLLDVFDLCAAIYLCATLPPEKVNDTFNIGAAVFSTMKQDFQAVLDDAGCGKRIICFPAAPVILALRLLEALHLSPLYKWVYETAAEDSYVSIVRSQEVLGFRPIFSNQEALLRNFQWYLEHRSEFQKSSGISHRLPWKQGILAVFKRFF